MPAYYNDNNAYVAQWLRNLIAAGHIAPGDVDERSIVDVRAGDLAGYSQCHFFAGIGGWSYALRLAGWPDDRPVWTGSCPCQPFSGLGQRRGTSDRRHLWPVWLNLIRAGSPAIIFGEQVAGGDGLEWLARVRTDLEIAAYAFGAANLPAGGDGAPQKRERLWFVAMGNTESVGWGESFRAFCPPAGGRAQARQPSWTGEVVLGEDGSRRRVKPGTQFLAHGIPDRMADLCAFGNAIVPKVAAGFIVAYRECRP